MQCLSARSSLAGCRLSVTAPPRATANRVALNVEAGKDSRTERNRARHRRIRNKVEGTGERPRLAVFRSNNHIHAQVIDDAKSHTVAAMSTLNPAFKEAISNGANAAAAVEVGKRLAAICIEKGISEVVFDRGGFMYHGRVKALADGAREGGLVF